jgi:hypothetical protein
MLIKQRKTKSRVGQNENIKFKQKQNYFGHQTQKSHMNRTSYYNSINYNAHTAVHCLVFTIQAYQWKAGRCVGNRYSFNAAICCLLFLDKHFTLN